MDYKKAYYTLIGQIDDIISELEKQYLPITTAIRDLKSVLLAAEDAYIKMEQSNEAADGIAAAGPLPR